MFLIKTILMILGYAVVFFALCALWMATASLLTIGTFLGCISTAIEDRFLK